MGMGFSLWAIPFVIITLLLLLMIVLAAFERKRPASSSESPLEILKKRYARGEITKEEFETMKKNLPA